MYNTVEFPNLFSGEITISRTAFSVFNTDIYWYGILITVGVVLGFLYAMKRAKSFGLPSDHVFDVAFAGAIGGFVGARAYFCIFNNLNPNTIRKYTLVTAITDIRDGGLAIYGGIIGAVLVALIFARIKKIPFAPILDLAGLGFFIGQGIGRLGNFVNQECYGAPTAGNLPWGMTGNIIASSPEVMDAQAALPAGEYALVHPAFLYELILCMTGFLIFHFYSKKLRSFDGEIFLLYAMWYGTGRGFIEGLRTDSLYLGDIKISQFVGFASAIIAFILFIYLKVTLKKKKTYTMLCDSEENKVVLEKYSDDLRLMKEKNAAKKALRENSRKEIENQKIAPSILGEGTESIVAEPESLSEKNEAENKE